VGQEPFRGKTVQTVPPGKRLYAELPGGGGFGDPLARDALEVADEVRAGLVSPEAAREVYGVVIDQAGSLDKARTKTLRASFKAST
jgi:N-methylhydantoinase B